MIPAVSGYINHGHGVRNRTTLSKRRS